jgi:hypothetical protein
MADELVVFMKLYKVGKLVGAYPIDFFSVEG